MDKSNLCSVYIPTKPSIRGIDTVSLHFLKKIRFINDKNLYFERERIYIEIAKRKFSMTTQMQSRLMQSELITLKSVEMCGGIRLVITDKARRFLEALESHEEYWEGISPTIFKTIE